MSQNQDSSKRRKPKFGLNVFLIEAFIFLSAQFLGLFVGYRLASFGYTPPQTMTVTQTVTTILPFIISFSVATVAIILALKYFKGGSIFKGLMAFLIFFGSWVVFSAVLPGYLPELVYISLAALIVLIRLKVPNIFTQNFAMVLAISGIGAMIGSELPVLGVIIMLAILSVYDFIAVFKTKHMISMFKGMFEKGAPFTIIVPSKLKHAKTKVKETKPGGGQFLMLGTGDIAFPIILSVSAIQQGLINSFAAILGALVGLVFVHILLSREIYKAMPALPPIAGFSVLFYLIAYFLI